MRVRHVQHIQLHLELWRGAKTETNSSKSNGLPPLMAIYAKWD